ncbi:lipopolysaccharide-induced tumor necrosis factor-alpha factor homolog [Ostrinia furnacalis]|uniref:lipopolysaccharide-induced tumor necrosis factor-alpha factor homolog n=1 Tax=Ostrinia furnacalis TaxID=93504 RepID=UPI00103E35BF|nr:lipopolysaccharide-induced tumor necrosis factor-alpha factor homolog [Ostrinia furnacalis]
MDDDGLPLYPQVYPNAKMERKEPVPQMAPAAVPPMQTGQLLGPENTVTVCQFCKASIKTAVKFTTTSRTHIAAALWGLLCCLCCVPYGVESAKNSDHYCPNCQRYLGTYVK